MRPPGQETLPHQWCANDLQGREADSLEFELGQRLFPEQRLEGHWRWEFCLDDFLPDSKPDLEGVSAVSTANAFPGALAPSSFPSAAVIK